MHLFNRPNKMQLFIFFICSKHLFNIPNKMHLFFFHNLFLVDDVKFVRLIHQGLLYIFIAVVKDLTLFSWVRNFYKAPPSVDMRKKGVVPDVNILILNDG